MYPLIRTGTCDWVGFTLSSVFCLKKYILQMQGLFHKGLG